MNAILDIFAQATKMSRLVLCKQHAILLFVFC